MVGVEEKAPSYSGTREESMGAPRHGIWGVTPANLLPRPLPRDIRKCGSLFLSFSWSRSSVGGEGVD